MAWTSSCATGKLTSSHKRTCTLWRQAESAQVSGLVGGFFERGRLIRHCKYIV